MFDRFDERQKELLTGALLMAGGLACWLAAFVGHVTFGALLAKIGGPLLIYGGMMLWRILTHMR